MTKRFYISIPRKKKQDIELIEPEPINPRIIGGVRVPEFRPTKLKPYEVFPPRWILVDLVFRYGGNLNADPPNYGSTPIEHWQYVDHRQMDTGRAIAMNKHPRRSFVERIDDVWEFAEFRPVLVPNPNYDPNWFNSSPPRDHSAKYEKVTSYETKSYYVEWDGVLPFPPPSASSSSFLGRDSYMWAVYFMVNGIPPASEWFPVPARNPDWNSLGVGEFVPDYTVPVWWDFS